VFEGTAWGWKKWTEKHSEDKTVELEVGDKGGKERSKTLMEEGKLQEEFKHLF
jgi:hypothetical protein